MSQLDLFETEEEKDLHSVEEGCKYCAACDQVLPTSNFYTMLTTGTGKQFYQAKCRSCQSARARVTYQVKKSAPPVSDRCDCCGKDFSGVVGKNIHMDHCDETETFRGWLCHHCNIGMGYLGDTLEGVTKAAAYLKRHKDEQR